MPRRIKKQLAYGSIFLLIILGIGLWIYWASLPAPSCTNGIKDRNETGADCGGVCTRACVPSDISKLEAPDLQVFHPIPGMASVLAEVRNSNSGWAAERAPFILNFYDADSNLLGSVSNETFLYASELKYISLYWQDPKAESVAKAEIVLGDPHWVPSAEFSQPQISIQSRSVGESGNQLEVSGKIASGDTLPLRQIEVLAVFYDRYGLPAGVSRTVIPSVSPGAFRDFSILHPALAGLDPNKTQLFAYGQR